ncbi:MAG: hypothetical protein QG629_150 [Patescibacteria group bacterium]|nr:FAD-binding oxidoreductase [Candidatus Saccharibacteria bacterium]MDQ5963068.1 hypothetical protein [Patescibacteria group bacterium]
MGVQSYKDDLRRLGFKGELDDDAATRDLYSHDASMFELRPELVARPVDSDDVSILVAYVAKAKKKDKTISLTGRSAGTDMSGGAINTSIIIDFMTHFNQLGKITASTMQTQPGVFYRDFDKVSREHGLLLPPYPASRDLAAVGGMVNNNAGGEKSIEFGKIENFVRELKVVFADGVERTVKPLNRKQLDQKMAQKDFEGEVYRKMFKLCDEHYDLIKAAKPKVSKDSTGYHVWNVWDREKEVFDLTQAIIGSQGTLGMLTDITFRMVPARSDDGILVIFMKDINNLGDLIKKVVASKPSRFESFDDQTLLLAIRFMPSFLGLLGPRKFLHLIISLIPDVLQLLRGMPKLVLMVSYKGNNEQEVRAKIHALHSQLKEYKTTYEINGFEEAPTAQASEKFWLMRRQSFNLLRSKVKDKHTAPFIDDFVVAPEHLSDFLPKLRKIIRKYKLFATIAGHMGDGNFHVIPLMKLEDPKDRAKILPAMREVNNLVLKYGGSLSGEHNDGLVRGPWLKAMYGEDVLNIMKEVKFIFDPENIFNPKKKTDATWDYSFKNIREHF